MLSTAVIEEVLAAALATGGDFSEVFVEDRYTNNLTLQSGKIENSLSGRDFGIGIRVFKGLQSVYTYTTDASKEGLLKAARNAAHAISGDKIIQPQPLVKEIITCAHPITINPKDTEKSRKADVMKKAYEIAKNYHSTIQQVLIRYLDEEQNVLIANSEGKFVEDKRVRSRLAIQSIASDGSQMQPGFYGPGAHKGFEFFENLNLEHYAGEASRIAVTMLGAEPCPSGKFPVIIDNEFGGVIFHEACGHGLEATSVAKNNSVFANRIGEKVASDVVTYIDDGTLENEWGSITIDDEGEKARKNVLIENGILKGYLIDKFNGRRMGMPSTGSGRRQSYRFAPTSRMTNTYIAEGESTPEEIIANTEHGIYAKYMGGGSVNPATGDYNFAVMEAYYVKNGKLGKPLKGATLIGNGAETLKLVDMVGNNLAHGEGMCGSLSGSIPVNVGQPMIRVSEMTVGGSKEAE
ncbi:TldD/PmbA family protein [Bacillus sp. DTU_2020_1000418_1_SI_GHA_SEK_038]|uniref:TldD/PmbA family protein n=1 Tax=Bacillus sp. DTU_2020_1000418_1_SI_GHA_SEK_038 TaxID=3077585 RepID=UPI0028E9EAF0|nr:TldD/PmbA family protein [Bacillus sp. DTU_2020_1000418_1_SI_GHA_SEK_038]WNS76346.1 TldD/PmbA family protein [Bacillus sp. DTU_2020_1000418_1_SI_GHA_SEK_038]